MADGLNQDEIKYIDEKNKKANTKRDSLGNVILYESPIDDTQKNTPDQSLIIDLLQYNLDINKIIEVIDTDIIELFQVETEVDRLNKIIEDLKNQLLNIQVSVSDEKTQSSEIITYVIPPDFASGNLSTTFLQLNFNTAIYNSDTRTIQNIGSPSKIGITYLVVDKNNNSIYASGEGNTQFNIINDNNGDFFEFNDKYDAIIKLTESKSNFFGWWIDDRSNGLNTRNLILMSNDDKIRMKFSPQKNTGNSIIDKNRNTFNIFAIFKDEAPNLLEIGNASINISTGLVSGNVLTELDNKKVEILYEEIDSSGKVVSSGAKITPFNITASKNNKIKFKLSEQYILQNKIDEIISGGWWEKGINEIYTKVNNSFEYIFNIDKITSYLALGYMDLKSGGDLDLSIGEK